MPARGLYQGEIVCDPFVLREIEKLVERRPAGSVVPAPLGGSVLVHPESRVKHLMRDNAEHCNEPLIGRAAVIDRLCEIHHDRQFPFPFPDENRHVPMPHHPADEGINVLVAEGDEVHGNRRSDPSPRREELRDGTHHLLTEIPLLRFRHQVVDVRHARTRFLHMEDIVSQ